MVPAMNRSRIRRFAAIVAAYAIALQALFTAFLVPGQMAFAGVEGSAICRSGAESGSPHQPSNRDECCAMCMSGCGAQPLGTTPRVVSFVPWSAGTIPTAARRADAALPRIADRGPHAARAPPAG
jgi:hypothetical protein